MQALFISNYYITTTKKKKKKTPELSYKQYFSQLALLAWIYY